MGFFLPAQRVWNLRTAPFFQPAPMRFNTALVFSLLVHSLLLSIFLGGQTFGLPGLNLPWKERRLGTNDLQILLGAPAPANISPTEIVKAAPATVNQPAVANNATSTRMSSPSVEHSEVTSGTIPPPRAGAGNYSCAAAGAGHGVTATAG